MSGLLLRRPAAATWRADALRGLQGRHPPKANPHTLSQEGGEEGSVDPDLGEAGCQVNTVLLQPEFLSQRFND